MKKYEIIISLFSKITFFFIFILLKNISCESEECSRETPIKMGNTCLSVFCSKNQFESGDCILSNSIIEKQWLNNIISVGEKNFRYLSFMTSLEGKMILHSSPNPVGKERIFFGIDSNASPIFKDENGNNAYTIKKNISRTDDNRVFETISGSIKFNQNEDINNEYFINIGKSETYTEIFDFENYNNDIIEIPYNEFINSYTQIVSGNLINLIENDVYYYILTLLKRVNGFFIY